MSDSGEMVADRNLLDFEQALKIILMRISYKLIIWTIIIILAGAILLSYAYFESRDYLSGPNIEISYPRAGATVYGPEVDIRGAAKNASFLAINDSQVLLDPSGSFSEKLPLPAGYNIMKFEAKDRFGKQTEKLLEFMVASTTPR